MKFYRLSCNFYVIILRVLGCEVVRFVWRHCHDKREKESCLWTFLNLKLFKLSKASLKLPQNNQNPKKCLKLLTKRKFSDFSVRNNFQLFPDLTQLKLIFQSKTFSFSRQFYQFLSREIFPVYQKLKKLKKHRKASDFRNFLSTNIQFNCQSFFTLFTFPQVIQLLFHFDSICLPSFNIWRV